MEFSILQIKDLENSKYAFMGYDFALRYGFTLDDYEEVYSSDIEYKEKDINAFLEKLFYIFNVKHPEDYHAHSLSVSDIIVVDGHAYYVDSFGYATIY